MHAPPARPNDGSTASTPGARHLTLGTGAAALEWTEALTLVTEGHVPDDVYQRVRQELSEDELAHLSLAIVAINGWNRLNVAARTDPGDYVRQPCDAYDGLIAQVAVQSTAAKLVPYVRFVSPLAGREVRVE